MRTGLCRLPGQARHTLGFTVVHQAVIGRVEVDAVDPVALRIVRAQLRTLAVGLDPQLIQLATGQRAVRRQPLHKRRGTLAQHRFTQYPIVAPEIAAH